MTEPTDIRESADGHPSCKDCEAPSCDQSGSRRRLLKALAAGGASISLAGCTLVAFGEDSVPRDRPTIDDDAGDEPNGEENGEEENGDDEDADQFAVYYRNEDQTLDISEDKSLLVAGEEEGMDLPYQCRQGFCGVCTARLWGDARERVEMDGNQFLEEDEIRDGFVLTCVGYPRSDFTLESGQRDALDR